MCWNESYVAPFQYIWEKKSQQQLIALPYIIISYVYINYKKINFVLFLLKPEGEDQPGLWISFSLHLHFM